MRIIPAGSMPATRGAAVLRAEVELRLAAQMRGVIETNVLADHANMASVDVRYQALQANADAFGYLYTQLTP